VDQVVNVSSSATQSLVLDDALRNIGGCDTTITIVYGGTYQLTQQFTISSRITITGANSISGRVVIIPSAAGIRHFSVVGGSAVLTLVSLDIANAKHQTSGSHVGGAVYAGAGSMVRFVDVTFRGNTISTDTFSSGAAVGCDSCSSFASISSRYLYNTVSTSGNEARGGAVFVVSASYMSISDTFIGNNASSTSSDCKSKGGAVYCQSATTFRMNTSAFIGNGALSTSKSEGGALYLLTPVKSPIIRSTTFTRNFAKVSSATGISASGGALYISTTTGIEVQAANVTFTSNQAIGVGSGVTGVYGGGAYVWTGSYISFTSSSFQYNRAWISSSSTSGVEAQVRGRGGMMTFRLVASLSRVIRRARLCLVCTV
jgi:hypothetical protein